MLYNQHCINEIIYTIYSVYNLQIVTMCKVVYINKFYVVYPEEIRRKYLECSFAFDKKGKRK